MDIKTKILVSKFKNNSYFVDLEDYISERVNEEKLDYSELREEIHKILCDFLSYEHPLQNDGEFDFEFLEFRTDDILKLIKRQGGSITK